MALKIAPDLDDEQITAIADAPAPPPLRCGDRHQHHAVARRRRGLPNAAETGGLSGARCSASRPMSSKLSTALAGELPIIGVGGIMGGEDAAEKIKAGASLVQFYSGFIYRGPDLVSEVAETLAIMLGKENRKAISGARLFSLRQAR
jgi:dihydroorotate dehydrogenase